MSLLAHCAASFVNAVGVQGPGEKARAIGRALGLDMRVFWTPRGEAFLKRVSKAVILEALRECDGTLDLTPFEKAKKAELIAMAEPVLANAQWLPGVLRQEGAGGG